jgi:hypothetical protein
MKRTDKYQLGVFQEGDLTDSQVEAQRWETLDAQIYGAFKILGNGIISGWNLEAGNNLSVVVSAGSGHVSYVAVRSPLSVIITSLTPNSRNYIYASLSNTSYWLQSVSFSVFLELNNTGRHVYLGYVDTNETNVISINTDGRNEIGYISEIRDLISEHQHIGGEQNPSRINLETEVQGELGSNNIEDLDASKINAGVLDTGRVPQLDHITKLINNGILTHAQLDSFVDSLSQTKVSLMGDISTTNLLKIILAVKRYHSDIDESLLNQLTMIPGITSTSFIDTVNSTASWDLVSGSIYAYPTGTPLRFFTKTFDVGYALKAFCLAYPGQIQFGISSSESDSESSSSAFSGGQEVRFAVTDKDSVDVNDYQYVDAHEVEDISSLSTGGKIKVMIEFDGEDGELILINGFAFMFSSTGPYIVLS